jgi:hypothetical protein
VEVLIKTFQALEGSPPVSPLTRSPSLRKSVATALPSTEELDTAPNPLPPQDPAPKFQPKMLGSIITQSDPEIRRRKPRVTAPKLDEKTSPSDNDNPSEQSEIQRKNPRVTALKHDEESSNTTISDQTPSSETDKSNMAPRRLIRNRSRSLLGDIGKTKSLVEPKIFDEDLHKLSTQKVLQA